MSIFDTAQAILDGIVAELGDTPDRCYVQSGLVAWDCEQLVLSVIGIRPGTPGNAGPGALMCGPSSALAQVSRLWCVPQGDTRRPPSTETLAEAAECATRGGEALWHATRHAVETADCNGKVTAANTLGPEGLYVAWQADLEWTL